MKNKDDEMSFAEKITDYTVLSEEIVDGYKIAVIKTHSGHTSRCRIPIRTPEEEEKFSADVCRSMIKFVYPDLDLSTVKRMEVQF